MNSPAYAIEVAALEKRYGATSAVDGISFSIATGEVFGLLGPNGAGKTTTVEILEGYRRADAGEVRVLGVDPWRDGDELRPRIGVMLQEGGLYPGVKPLEALQLFASYYDDPDEPERLLHLVRLDARTGQPLQGPRGPSERHTATVVRSHYGCEQVEGSQSAMVSVDARAAALTVGLPGALRTG